MGNLRTLVCAASALLAATAPAQAPEVWADLVLPGPVVATQLDGQGKLVRYDEGSMLHVFSSTTRRWDSTPKTPGALLRLFNDCLINVEPGLCRGYSSYGGHFADLPIAPPANLMNPSGQINDSLVLVHAGNQLHAFSAFTGQWTSRAVTPMFSVEVERHVAVLSDGAVLAGMSAFDGRWVDLTAQVTVSGLDADGTTAFAVGGDTVHAFSAHTRSWRVHTHPTRATATFTRGDDWGMWVENGELLAFSGLRGEFVRESNGAGAVAASSDLFALVDAPNGYFAWSAVTADLLYVPRRASLVKAGTASALLIDPQRVRGYSPLRQTTAMLHEPTSVRVAGTDVAHVVTTGGRTWAWSSTTGTWHAAPAASTGATPTATTTTVAVDTATDCHAFDARNGQWVALGRPLQLLTANPSSAPLLGHDATTLWAFDTGRGRWRGVPRTSTTAPIYGIWRTSAIVLDGLSAHAIGAQHGEWSSHQLPASSAGNITPHANSEVAFLSAGNLVAAAAMLPEISSWQQFPHFRRVQPLGAPLAFSATLAAGAAAVAALGAGSDAVAVPGLGELFVDPAAAVLTAIPPSPNAHTTALEWALPAAPQLLGATLCAQLFVVPPAPAAPWLSSPATVQIW